MIVLRITIDGVAREVRSEKAEALIGTGDEADIQLAVPGWKPLTARLHHRGTEAFIETLDGSPSRALRLGDEVQMGSARVALVGLMPMADAKPDLPVFGGYDLEPGTPRTFTLADDDNPVVGTQTTSHTFPPQDHRPSIGAKPQERPRQKPAASTSKPAKQTAKTEAAGGGKPKTKASTTTQTKPRPQQRTKRENAVVAALAAAADSQASTEAEQEKAARALKGSDDFSSELYSTLRKSPFFAVSIAFHFLIFVAIALLDTDVRFKGVGDAPSLQVSEVRNEDDPLREYNEYAEDDIPEPPSELEIPDMLEDQLDDNEKTPDNKPKDRSDAPELTDLPEVELRPVDVGLAPRYTAFRNRTRKKTPKVNKTDLEKKVLKGGDKKMNDRSAGIVRGALGLGPGGGQNGKWPRRSEVLVVDGAFDDIEAVLDSLKLPYVKADPLEVIRGRKYKLASYKVIFWNCGENLPEAWMKRFRPRLKRWIAQGGYLFSTDWGIAVVAAPMFPELIKTSGQRAPIREMVLHITPATQSKTHPLLKGVFTGRARGQWWLEQASFDIQVLDKEAVDVLIEAPQLKDVFQRSPVVAIAFDHGRGRVLHVMGHYYQKMGNLAGTIASHRLALNFVMDRVRKDKR